MYGRHRRTAGRVEIELARFLELTYTPSWISYIIGNVSSGKQIAGLQVSAKDHDGSFNHRPIAIIQKKMFADKELLL